MINVVNEALSVVTPSEADSGDGAGDETKRRSMSIISTIDKAKLVALDVFDNDKPMWADGVIDETEFNEGMQAVVAVIESEDDKKKVMEHAAFAYNRELEAAKGDLLSKEAMSNMVYAATEGLGGDAQKAVI